MDLFSKLFLSTTGINVKPTTGGEPVNNGDITYNLSLNKFRKKENGSITDLDTGGGGGITRSVNNISGNTTAGSSGATDYVYFCTSTLTLTMPTAVGNTNRYTVKCIGGTLTIDGAGAETIEGTATIEVAIEDSVDLISNNTEWKIV
jgi:hypothetical protein